MSSLKLEGKKVLVIGAARSGIASANFLAKRGATVALNDAKPIDQWDSAAVALKAEGIGCLAGDIPGWLLDQLELVIVSPGVPTNSIPIRYAERAGAEVMGEVELAARFLKGRIVAITGSNGKTTTTSLVGEILKCAGFKTQIGGNIGTALISMVETSDEDTWTVAEVSSFQLETIKEFRPNVAAVLNVTPNHMDRYESFTHYAAAKHRIFMNQRPGDVAILNADDEIVSGWARGLRAHVAMFSVKKELEAGLFLRGRDIVSASSGREKILMSRDQMKLRGLHNVENVLAALAMGLACGAAPESMRATVNEFQPVEHRLEFVAEIDGVKFYNDSKATSVDATLKALEAFAGDETGKVILILGGRGKKAPYAPLEALVKETVRKIVLIGEEADTIANELGGFAPTERAASMKDAVRLAQKAACSGDTVLLAPACASFDMFGSFEHRGKVFKEEVSSLKFKVSSLAKELGTRNSKLET